MRRLDVWNLVDRLHGIWRSDAGKLRTRQLYTDGIRLPLAARRFPFGEGAALDADGIVPRQVDMAGWRGNPEAVWQVESGGIYSFVETSYPIATISGETRLLIAQPCLRHAQDLYDSNSLLGLHRMMLPNWLENSRSFLADPG